MEFLKLKEDIKKFENADDITVEAILGIFQDVFSDVRAKFGKGPELCGCVNPTDLASKLIWFTNQLSKIEKQNHTALDKEGRLKRLLEREEALEQELQKYSAKEQAMKDAEIRTKNLEEEIFGVRKSIDGMQDVITGLHRKEKEYQELQKKEDALSEQKKNLEKQAAAFREISVKPLEEEIEGLLRVSVSLQESQKELLKKKERLNEETGKAEETIQALNEKIAVRESDIRKKEEMAKTLEEKEQELKKKAAEFNIQEQQYQILCESVAAMERKIDSLKESVREKKPYERQLKEEEKSLIAQASELQIAIAALTEQNPQLKAKNEEDENRAAHLGDERQALQAAQEKISGEIESLNREISDLKMLTRPMLDSSLQTARKEKERLEEEQKRLQEQIEAQKREISKTTAEIEKQNTELQAADTRLKEKRNEQERVLNAIESINLVTSQLTREIADMENSLEEKNASDLQTALEQKKRDLKKMLSDFNQTYMEFEAESSRLISLEDDVRAKKQELSKKKERHTQIQNEYHRAVEGLSILAQRDDEIEKMEKQLKGFRQIETMLREQSEILSARTEGDTFVITGELQRELGKAEKTISAFREAIVEYTEITRKRLEELS